MSDCTDPYHIKESISSQVYDECPQCKGTEQFVSQWTDIYQKMAIEGRVEIRMILESEYQALVKERDQFKDQYEWQLREKQQYIDFNKELYEKCNTLAKERDQLKAEVERLRPMTFEEYIKKDLANREKQTELILNMSKKEPPIKKTLYDYWD